MNTAEKQLDAVLEMFLEPQRMALKQRIARGYRDAFLMSHPKDEDPAYLEGFHVGYVEGQLEKSA